MQMERRAATRAAKMLHKKWIRALTINLHRDYSNSLTSVKVGELFLELNSRTLQNVKFSILTW